jgi:hypothetical protein
MPFEKFEGVEAIDNERRKAHREIDSNHQR